jgi:opacity protein-like surface antigen
MKKIFYLLMALPLCFSPVKAQQGSLSFGLGSAYILTPAEFTGSIAGGGYGAHGGLNISGKMKFNLASLPMRLSMQLDYSTFTAEGARRYDINLLDLETFGSLASLGAMSEWYFAEGFFSPYAGAGLTVNSVTMRLRVNGVSNANVSSVSSLNFGFILSAGTEIAAFDSFYLDLCAKYIYYNAFAKDFEEDNERPWYIDELPEQHEQGPVQAVSVTLSAVIPIGKTNK